jgi:hypothetical protein
MDEQQMGSLLLPPLPYHSLEAGPRCGVCCELMRAAMPWAGQMLTCAQTHMALSADAEGEGSSWAACCWQRC